MGDVEDGFPTIEDVQELLMNESSTPIGPDPVEDDPGGSGEPSAPEPPVPAEPKVEEPPKPTDSGDGQPEPSTPVTPPEEEPAPPAAASAKEQELEAKLALLEQSNRELIARMSQAPAPAPAPTEGQRQRVFNLDVPEKLADDLFSEEPRTRSGALKFLVNAIAEETYHKAVTDMRTHVEQYVPAQVHAVTRLTSEQENTRRDFYTSFPELDKPGLHGTVVQVAEMVMQEYNTMQWSQPLRNEIGRRVKAILAGVPQAAATPPPTQATSAVRPPVRQTARVGTPGARPSQAKPTGGGFADQAGELLGVNL